MTGWLLLTLIVLYGAVGQVMTHDAYRHLRKPKHTYFYTPLLSPEEFTAEGEHKRQRAVRFWYGGLAVLAVVWVLLP